MSLHEELLVAAGPVLAKVQDHPFWAGLRDGSLPGDALSYFVQQDTRYLLPAYARALALCAATASENEHTVLFARSAASTLAARDRLWAAYVDVAAELDLPEAREQRPIDPATHAYASFFVAAAVTSPYAGVGALLPMVWFNFQVANDLVERAVPGSRYARWIDIYHPGKDYEYAVRAFLGAVDAVGARCSAAQREEIAEQFRFGVRYEWAFAESCLRQPGWPV
jgi:thiaminase/transcriptional activator TenA